MSHCAITFYDWSVGRWEPNAQGRLTDAALDLFAEWGFEQTTVADIAERAGLTPRTFFRYFADKRDVLFAGSAEWKAHMVAALRETLDETGTTDSPLQAVTTALGRSGDEVLGERREFARRRQRIIAANDELRERELVKLAAVAAAFADTLRQHGIERGAAALAGETGIAIFKIGFERWIASRRHAPLSAFIDETANELGGIASSHRPAVAH
jgi:AcrR family transcriptional regulator